MDTTNKFGVSCQGDKVCLMAPPRPAVLFTQREALVLAAYLMLMADPANDDMPEVMKAVLTNGD